MNKNLLNNNASPATIGRFHMTVTEYVSLDGYIKYKVTKTYKGNRNGGKFYSGRLAAHSRNGGLIFEQPVESLEAAELICLVLTNEGFVHSVRPANL